MTGHRFLKTRRKMPGTSNYPIEAIKLIVRWSRQGKSSSETLEEVKKHWASKRVWGLKNINYVIKTYINHPSYSADDGSQAQTPPEPAKKQRAKLPDNPKSNTRSPNVRAATKKHSKAEIPKNQGTFGGSAGPENSKATPVNAKTQAKGDRRVSEPHSSSDHFYQSEYYPDQDQGFTEHQQRFIPETEGGVNESNDYEPAEQYGNNTSWEFPIATDQDFEALFNDPHIGLIQQANDQEDYDLNTPDFSLPDNPFDTDLPLSYQQPHDTSTNGNGSNEQASEDFDLTLHNRDLQTLHAFGHGLQNSESDQAIFDEIDQLLNLDPQLTDGRPTTGGPQSQNFSRQNAGTEFGEPDSPDNDHDPKTATNVHAAEMRRISGGPMSASFTRPQPFKSLTSEYQPKQLTNTQKGRQSQSQGSRKRKSSDQGDVYQNTRGASRTRQNQETAPNNRQSEGQNKRVRLANSANISRPAGQGGQGNARQNHGRVTLAQERQMREEYHRNSDAHNHHQATGFQVPPTNANTGGRNLSFEASYGGQTQASLMPPPPRPNKVQVLQIHVPGIPTASQIAVLGDAVNTRQLYWVPNGVWVFCPNAEAAFEYPAAHPPPGPFPVIDPQGIQNVWPPQKNRQDMRNEPPHGTFINNQNSMAGMPGGLQPRNAAQQPSWNANNGQANLFNPNVNQQNQFSAAPAQPTWANGGAHNNNNFGQQAQQFPQSVGLQSTPNNVQLQQPNLGTKVVGNAGGSNQHGNFNSQNAQNNRQCMQLPGSLNQDQAIYRAQLQQFMRKHDPQYAMVHQQAQALLSTQSGGPGQANGNNPFAGGAASASEDPFQAQLYTLQAPNTQGAAANSHNGFENGSQQCALQVPNTQVGSQNGFVDASQQYMMQAPKAQGGPASATNSFVHGVQQYAAQIPNAQAATQNGNLQTAVNDQSQASSNIPQAVPHDNELAGLLDPQLFFNAPEQPVITQQPADLQPQEGAGNEYEALDANDGEADGEYELEDLEANNEHDFADFDLNLLNGSA